MTKLLTHGVSLLGFGAALLTMVPAALAWEYTPVFSSGRQVLHWGDSNRGGVVIADHYGNYVSVWSDEHHDIGSGTPSTNVLVLVACHQRGTQQVEIIEDSFHLWFTYWPVDIWCNPDQYPVDALVGAQ